MEKLGVPACAVNLWSKSIGKMQRFWDVNHATFGPFDTARGYPEGDTHSVLVMLGISIAWLLTLEHATKEPTSPQQLFPTAYADNWGWVSLSPALHQTAVSCTLQTTSLFGLEVDWNKTWMFATNTEGSNLASRAISLALEGTQVPRAHHAKDLGLEIRYSGIHQLGHKTERYEQGFRRLQRLNHLPEDSDIKEQIWLVSIYPVCFMERRHARHPRM